jgi:hypothetical protein
MKFAQVRFDKGDNVVTDAQVVERKRPTDPGYWAEYWPNTGSSPVWVGPFVSESDALASGLVAGDFKNVILNTLPPLSVQSVYHRDNPTPYGLIGAEGDPEEWASWGKAFASIEARDEWLQKAGFVVSGEIEGLPIEWNRP